MSNVTALPGCTVPSGNPNQELIAGIRDLLEMAEKGILQSYIGTGFTVDGFRVASWLGNYHSNVYEMLGSIAWLQHEYVDRQISKLDTSPVGSG